MKTQLAALALGGLAVLSPSALADETWYDDYDAAVVAAKEQGKDLLVDFTGSDWCGWCIKLHDEVFAHDEWIKAVQADYILVALDFPRSEEAKAKVPNPKRNEELQAQHSVRGFPTILLMTNEGDVFGQTGYQAGGPAAYVKHMAELRTARPHLVGAKRAAEAFAAAEGDAKWPAWEAAVTVLEAIPAGAPFAPQLKDSVSWAIEADKDNAKGAKARAVKALLIAGLGDAATADMALELDPKNEQGMLDHVAKSKVMSVRDDVTARAALAMIERVDALGFKDKVVAFELHLQAAQWCAGPLNDAEGKVKFATRAKEIGSDDEAKLKMLESLLK